ncbi:MAG: molybdopterin molybdotransferase MoeA [Betaproteobacteria bacterium]|uniref:molybdopterin molybdotransferase MoeA n=1 Tax=Ferrovum sp. PN-J185 TaxID=1356306 RepID=UPI0007928839|nr:gephyrin-like molybdotransferase Glp [Ferrovum sp. PN-J185]KXW56675.1 molybdopterin molybdenumtransferase [Ferrovum sp. PN-J185]MDE1892000.1 molybdopterin molybdotransferase MoeA [Betaproteobacteria bacterium]MDE2056551.1 molybdopterin molybdotransferase MoeA [Betaproteobacteria bacterium]
MIHSLPPLNEINDYDPNSLTVDKARELIQRYLTPVAEQEEIAIYDALQRVTADNILAPHNVPNHNNSAMDGYAFHSRELISPTVELKVVGNVYAGHPFTQAVASGEAVRIMTGAVIPEGVDTVIMQEHVVREGDSIRFDNKQISVGQNIRLAGEDIKQGAVAVKTGQLITPAHMGLIASLGIPTIKVYRRLKVAFFSTGDELSSVGEALKEGQIYDSNRYSLKGLLTSLPVECKDFGVVRDNPSALKQVFNEASQWADVIISSGGVSVGDADFIKTLMAELGQVVFWKIAMKPGRPLAYGKINHSHFFGLPGNPVAVMVTFYQFVQHALYLLAGQETTTHLPQVRYRLAQPIKKTPGRMEFQRGIVFKDSDNEWRVKVTGNQSSGVLSSMTQANCFIVLSQECGSLNIGDWVEVELFNGIM